jgi:hypothetical protein
MFNLSLILSECRVIIGCELIIIKDDHTEAEIFNGSRDVLP